MLSFSLIWCETKGPLVTDLCCIATLFFVKKAKGMLLSPLCYILLNHLTKFNRIWCVSYSHEWGPQRQFLLPRPLVPWLGLKRSKSFNLILITKSISMIFIPNFVCVLTIEIYKTYQTGFSFCCPVHAPGMGFWGARVAQRVKKIKHIRLDFYSVAWIMLRSQKSKSVLLSVRYAVS